MNLPATMQKPAERWAERISQRWQESLEAIIDVCRMLCEAKAQLPHGEFEKMIEGNLPFGPRTARKLMVINRDARLLNPEHRPLLPSSWTTLYAITKLSDAEFQSAVGQKVIRADAARWEIEGFRSSAHKGERPDEDVWSPSFPSPDVRRWTKSQVRLYAKILKNVVDHMGSSSDVDAVGDVVGDEKLRLLFLE